MNSLHDTVEVTDLSNEFWNIIRTNNISKYNQSKIALHSNTIWKNENDIETLNCPNLFYDPSTDFYVYDNILQLLIDIEKMYSHIIQMTQDSFYQLRQHIIQGIIIQEQMKNIFI